MKSDVLRLGTIEDYCNWCGFDALHPLVTVVDMRDFSKHYPADRVNLDLYAVWLTKGSGFSVGYGLKQYKYTDCSLVCFGPGQVVQVDTQDRKSDVSVGLIFHHDLLLGTHLGKKLSRYSFFSYSSSEALYTTAGEMIQCEALVDRIHDVLKHCGPKTDKAWLCDLIECLLDICLKCYDRQVVVHEAGNSDILSDFERALTQWYESGSVARKGFPSVAGIADILNLSPNYLGEQVKQETGVNVRDYIKSRIILLSKQALLATDLPISSIANMFGFTYPQHFTRLFKNMTGVSPAEYRRNK
ncbi:MAG: AraC family transcriptional regulator [Bacteroidales bacterium]|nr:AraC family transcriptional regulator [Bacteroidales bacterium]